MINLFQPQVGAEELDAVADAKLLVEPGQAVLDALLTYSQAFGDDAVGRGAQNGVDDFAFARGQPDDRRGKASHAREDAGTFGTSSTVKCVH